MRSKAKHKTLVSVSSQRTCHWNNKYNTMKVYQIVSEVGVLSALKTGYNAFKGARSAVPGAADAAQKAATAAAKKAQAIKDLAAAGKPSKAAIDAATATTKATATSVDDVAKTASWWDKEAVKLATKIAGKEDKLAAGALKSSILSSKADDIVGFMYKAQILKEAGVYWYKSNQIDNDPNLSPEQKKEAIRKLRGEFILSVIAPKVGTWAISKVAFPLKLIPWLTKISGSPNAAEVMKYLSKRGTEAALITWFAAGGGKQWLNDTMGFLVTGVGSAPELVGTVYEVVKAGAQVATGNIPAGAETDGASGSDPNDPISAFNKAISGGKSGWVDPAIGTGRGGK
jgi:hypothetical protein